MASEDWDGAADLGSAAVEPLMRVLRDSRELLMQEKAAESLVKIGESAVHPLIDTLKDEKMQDIASAILVDIGTPSIKPLIEALKDRDLRISGAVVGDSINYDPDSLTISFEVAHIPGDNDEINAQGGLAAVLNYAVTNAETARLDVIYVGPKPDLLQNEAQAIMTGRLGEDGTFYADELLLKCPTKYEDAVPDQVEG